MNKRERSRQQWEENLWDRQHNLFINSGEKIRFPQRGNRADGPLSPDIHAGKMLTGVLLLISGLAIRIAYPSSASTLFCIAAVLAGGALILGGAGSKA